MTMSNQKKIEVFNYIKERLGSGISHLCKGNNGLHGL